MATNPEEVEQQVRTKLEASGQLGKMRAMIVDATLQALSADKTDEQGQLFSPSENLLKAKETEEGRLALSVVADYLKYLGLSYTCNVLHMETGVDDMENASTAAASLRTSGSAMLLALLQQRGGQTNESPVHEQKQLDPKAPDGAAAAVVEKPALPSTSTESSVSSKPSSTPQQAGVKHEAEVAPPPGEDTTYYIAKWSNKTFLRHQQVSGQQVQLEYLNNCTVTVLDPLDSMTVDDCEGGELVIAACEGSVFLRNCKNMTVHVACKQLRTRDCENIELHIFTTTDPVVEMSHHMTFRPFHLRLPSLKRAFADARLDPTQNRFVHVYDFTAGEASLPQPHFTVLYPNHAVVMEDRMAEKGSPECPPEIEDLLVGKLLPAASSESGQNKSYDIKTGAQAWAAEEPSGSSTEATESENIEDVPAPKVDAPAAGAGLGSAPPSGSAGRPPAVPSVPTAHRAAPAASGLDDQDYSSFDDESTTSEEDKYAVDEDDDDF